MVQQIRQNWKLVRIRWAQAMSFGMIWALFLAAHASINLHGQGWLNMTAIGKMAAIIFAGAFLGGTIGWSLSLLLSGHRIAPKRFATAFVIILLATIGISAAIFSLQYRLYYSQWHHPAFTIGWAFQMLFTTASSVYLFSVQGLRLLLPFGPVGLIVATLVFVKSTKACITPTD